MTDYKLLNTRLQALITDTDYEITNLANASALLFHSLCDINWAGFYIAKDKKLLLGPFQGKTACTVIPFGKGVCGTAAKKRRTVLVDDIHHFKGHIACDSNSNSEIVIPIIKNGEVYAVLDIDSPKTARFTDEDKAGLEAFAKIIENSIRQ